MKTLKVFGIAIIVLFIVSSAFALSADKGNFITLGREGDDGMVDEKISLYREPAGDVITARLQSGIAVLVLDERVEGGEKYYIVSTVGREGGIMGWTTEEYIYEVLSGPPEE